MNKSLALSGLEFAIAHAVLGKDTSIFTMFYF